MKEDKAVGEVNDKKDIMTRGEVIAFWKWYMERTVCDKKMGDMLKVTIEMLESLPDAQCEK